MITHDDVVYLARLSRLDLSDADLAVFVPHLQQILAYIEQLRAVDTTGIEPAAHVLPLRNVARADAPQESLPRDAALQSAPHVRDGFFHVPAVIE
jgi:aspartyl-tRNA(Asn)/glutamyl-tRNA(Gln) amidotransferase subunit C